jgi:hypothetical protein
MVEVAGTRRKIGPLEAAVRKAARAGTLHERDFAVQTLAIAYARQLDEGGELDALGPRLLAALESMGLTPRSRALILAKRAPKSGGETGTSKLAQLRLRRSARPSSAG